jgi:hypothetical protein
VYSSVERASPARTSREELVTPPRTEQTFEDESHLTNPESLPTLVGTRVFEQNDLAFLEMQTSLLGQEQISTLNNVFKVRFAIGVDKRSHIRNIDGFRSKIDLKQEKIILISHEIIHKQVILTVHHKERTSQL